MRKIIILFLLIFLSIPVNAKNFEYKYGRCKYVYHPHNESSYNHAYALMYNGIEEYELPDKSRIDVYIPNKYVCELDFANKIYEMFGQLAWYSLQTGLKGKGVIILDKKYEKQQMYYVQKARKMAEAYGFEIEVITDDILNLDKNDKCPYKDCKCNRKNKNLLHKIFKIKNTQKE